MRPDDTAPDGAVLIPLRARDGSVRAYAIVDAADADWVNQWRWCLLADGYAVRTDRSDGRQRTVYLHREVLGVTSDGAIDGDHIDRDRLNDRRVNLRPSTKQGNPQNQSSHRDSTSEFRGVSWNKRRGKWRAQIHVAGKSVTLGHFDDETEAAEVARAARMEAMPHAID